MFDGFVVEAVADQHVPYSYKVKEACKGTGVIAALQQETFISTRICLSFF